ncbi:MAG: hypothetical protein ABSB80_05985 [Methanoregula sp.]|jgi:hypothetical protein|uniref:hypothetical protein n=1 Tax=Methanoregula sp. TaxID=2052170 RepID=UPI003D097BE7
MSKTYEKIKLDGQYELGKNLVKTYQIESNYKDVSNFKDSFAKIANNGQKYLKVGVDKIEEAFYLLTLSKKESQAIFYLDTTNPRFWTLHTKSNVKDSDYLLKSTIQPIMSHLDNLWLDRKMLDQIYHDHADYLRGIGVQYRYGDVFPTDDVGETFTMRAHGAPSEEFLKLIKDNPQISKFFAVSSIGFKKESNINDNHSTPIDITIEDVNYWGKFTVKGTSFYQHIEVVDDIQGKYEGILKIVEDEFNLSYTGNKENIKIHGSPACIDLKREIKNIDEFVKIVFSSKEPFRLSGYSKKLDSGTTLVAGVDLHNGDDFNLEITPYWMRMYLPKDACGNTIMRFICNLQRYYDANASLEGLEGLNYGSTFKSHEINEYNDGFVPRKTNT